MKATSLLLSFILAFTTVYSKAVDININDKIISEQLNVSEEDNSFELVKSNDYNFIYKFHCSDEGDYCEGIKNNLEFAFMTISNAFEIYQPIVFEVFVDDLIGKYKYTDDKLAGVFDLNYVPLKASESNSSTPYLYPQTLVKQLKLNKQPKYKKNDFIMIINNWASNPEKRNNEYRSLLTHELLHGLGFDSLASVSELNSNDNSGGPLVFNENAKYAIFPYVLPSFNEKLLEITDITEFKEQLDDSKVSQFLPFSVFDKNIVSLKSGEKIFEKLQSYYEEVSEKCLDGTPLTLKDLNDKYRSSCFSKLSNKTQEIVTSIIKENYFEHHTLGILTNDGDMVPLQTMDNTYVPGSSVIHTANPLYDKASDLMREGNLDSLNELMNNSTGIVKKEAILKYYDDNYILYFSDEDNFTVEEMLEFLPNNEKHPLIGEGIIKILKTFGWTEKGKKESTETYYLDESFDIPEANGFEYLRKKTYEIEAEILKNPFKYIIQKLKNVFNKIIESIESIFH